MTSITPESYCDLFDRLERNNVPYVVGGGGAVVLRGHVRPIVDLDTCQADHGSPARHPGHRRALALEGGGDRIASPGTGAGELDESV